MMPELTADDIVSEFIIVRMMDKRKTFVMVEGETDRVLWTEYMIDCALIPTRGKDVILDALKSYVLRGSPGVAAIVDADYWLIAQPDKPHIDNLLYDDCCPDVELILLNSPALEEVLQNAFYDYESEQIHEFAEKLKDEALHLAAELGYFRLLNHIEDYGLKFKEIHFEEFIDGLKLDRDWIARRLAENERGISSEALLQEIEELRKKYPQEEYNIQLCRGKDALDIMVYILPILFKSQFGDDLLHIMNDKELTGNLRMSYEYGYFEKTSLFSRIREWESNNTPYRIIRQGWTNHAQT